MKLGFIWLTLLVLGASASVSPQKPDPPGVVAAVAPVYPPIAAAAHATGIVNVDVKIDANGKVNSAHAVDGFPLLKAACEAAARRWKFLSATDSNPVRIARLTFTFREVEDRAPEAERTPVFLPPYKIEVAGPKLLVQTVH